MTPFALGLANVTDKPVVQQTAGACSGQPTWFRLRVGGELLSLFGGCECPAEDPSFLCPVPPPFWQANAYQTVDPGEEFKLDWDGAYWPMPSTSGGCTTRAAVTRDTEIELTVCWLKETPADDFVEPLPEEYSCSTRTFTPGVENAFWMVPTQ